MTAEAMLMADHEDDSSSMMSMTDALTPAPAELDEPVLCVVVAADDYIAEEERELTIRVGDRM